MEKAIFLDRDGVLNKKPPEQRYVLSKNELFVHPHTPSAIRLIKSKGYKVFVVTNQRGIARGLITSQKIKEIHSHLNLVIYQKARVKIDGFYVCPHNYGECQCRKPQPGLVLKAALEHNIDLPRSWLVGDSEIDIDCGKRAGVGHLRQMKTDQSLWKVVKDIFDNE